MNQTRNTDKEIWRREPDDYYSPSIHVTEDGAIGLNVSGNVLVQSIEDWHGVGTFLQDLETDRDEWKRRALEAEEAATRALDTAKMLDETREKLNTQDTEIGQLQRENEQLLGALKKIDRLTDTPSFVSNYSEICEILDQILRNFLNRDQNETP